MLDSPRGLALSRFPDIYKEQPNDFRQVSAVRPRDHRNAALDKAGLVTRLHDPPQIGMLLQNFCDADDFGRARRPTEIRGDSCQRVSQPCVQVLIERRPERPVRSDCAQATKDIPHRGLGLARSDLGERG